MLPINPGADIKSACTDLFAYFVCVLAGYANISWSINKARSRRFKSNGGTSRKFF